MTRTVAGRRLALLALAGIVLAPGVGGADAPAAGRCEPRGAGNQRALQYLDGVLASGRGDAGAWTARARCHYFLRRYPEAVADASEAIRRDGTQAEAFLVRARASKMLGRKDAALADYSRSIALRPTAETYFGRGYTYMQEFRSRDQEALEDLTAAIRLNPRHEEAYILRAKLYGKLNHFARAIEDYKILIGLDRNHAPNYCNMGLAHYGLGQDGEGRRWLQACYERDRDPDTRRYYEGEIQRLAWRQAMKSARPGRGAPGFFSKSYATDAYSCSLAGGSWSNDYCY